MQLTQDLKILKKMKLNRLPFNDTSCSFTRKIGIFLKTIEMRFHTSTKRLFYYVYSIEERHEHCKNQQTNRTLVSKLMNHCTDEVRNVTQEQKGIKA